MSTTCGCEHCHSHGSSGLWMPTISFVLLVIGLIGKYSGISWFAESWIEAIWFLVAFLPVGLPVMREAWEAALRKDFFSEFSLMAIASIGALEVTIASPPDLKLLAFASEKEAPTKVTPAGIRRIRLLPEGIVRPSKL